MLTSSRIIGWITVILSGVCCLQAAQPQSAGTDSQSAAPYRTALNRYCVTCHNEQLKTANLMLDKMEVEKVSAEPAVWEKVVRKLRSGAMPPPGAPRPDAATYNSFASYLETELDRLAAAKPNPGR